MFKDFVHILRVNTRSRQIHSYLLLVSKNNPLAIFQRKSCLGACEVKICYFVLRGGTYNRYNSHMREVFCF